EHVPVDLQVQGEELLPAHQVCHRTALDPLPYQVPEAAARFLRRLLGEARVQIDAPAAQGVGQQDLRVQARVFRALTAQVLRGPVEQGADGPGVRAWFRVGAGWHAHEWSTPFLALWGRGGHCWPRRCFLSKSFRAWITSARLPAMIASSLYRFR